MKIQQIVTEVLIKIKKSKFFQEILILILPIIIHLEKKLIKIKVLNLKIIKKYIMNFLKKNYLIYFLLINYC
jgi:hypothetical protein